LDLSGEYITIGAGPGITYLDMFSDAGWGWDEYRGHLFRTDDGAESWTEIPLPAGNPQGISTAVFLDAQTGWVQLSSTRYGREILWHTEDGGKSWTDILYTGLEYISIPPQFHFINTTEGWVELFQGAAGNLYVQIRATRDGGASFQPVPLISPDADPGLQPGELHLCGICGDLLDYRPSHLLIAKGDMASMEPRGALLLLASFNLSVTWSELKLPLPEGYDDALLSPLEFTFLDEENGFLAVKLVRFAPDGSALYQVLALYSTKDGGRTWKLAPAVLEGLPDYPAFQVLSPEDIFLECGAAICATHDGAQSWQRMPLQPSLVPDADRFIQQVQFIDPSTGWLLLQESSANTDTFTLYKTTDGAETWIAQ
jgi:photosystem II stability/assembly factor-like uncharacterized protein